MLTLPFRTDARLGTIAKTFGGQDFDCSPALLRHQAPSSADRCRPTHSVVFGGTKVGPPTAERRRGEPALSNRPHLMFLAHRPRIAHMFEAVEPVVGGYSLPLGLAARYLQSGLGAVFDQSSGRVPLAECDGIGVWGAAAGAGAGCFDVGAGSHQCVNIAPTSSLLAAQCGSVSGSGPTPGALGSAPAAVSVLMIAATLG